MEMVDRIVRLVSLRWRVILPLALLAALPEPVLTIIGTYLDTQTREEGAQRQYGALIFVLAFALPQWPNAALLLAGFHGHLFPLHSIRAVGALRSALGRLPYLILTRLYVWMLLGLLAFPLILAGTRPAISLTVLVGILLGIIAFLVFAGLWFLVPVLVMVEHKSFFRAMARSMELMTTRFSGGWLGDSPLRRLVVMGVFPLVLFAGELILLQAAWPFLRPPAGSQFPADYGGLFAFTAVQLAINFVLALWMPLSMAMLYGECRMRREGMDLHVRLEAQTESVPSPVVY